MTQSKPIPENYILENGKLMFDAHEAQRNKRKNKSKAENNRKGAK